MKKLLIQKSIGRAGGTLLRLVLGRVFNDEKCFKDYTYRWPVKKTHEYENIVNKNNYLITQWRDPRDVIVSLMRINHQEYSNTPAMKFKADRVIKTFHSIRKAEKQNPTLVLKYENWHNDFDHLFNILEKTFDGKINDEIRNSIKKDFSKDSIKKIQSRYTDFSSFDRHTHIHGDHVSTGLSTWKDNFSPDQIKILNNKLKPYIDYWEKIT